MWRNTSPHYDMTDFAYALYHCLKAKSVNTVRIIINELHLGSNYPHAISNVYAWYLHQKLEWSIIGYKLKLNSWKIRTICQLHHLSTPSRYSVLLVTGFCDGVDKLMISVFQFLSCIQLMPRSDPYWCITLHCTCLLSYIYKFSEYMSSWPF